MTEKIHDDVERALEAFGGVKFSYHTFGRFAIQPRLWVTAEKNPPALDLPPMDDGEAGDGQPRFQMDPPPAVHHTETHVPPSLAAVAEPPPVPLRAPPPRRDLTWADPGPVAPPPRRPAPLAVPEEEPEIEPMPVFGRAPAGGPLPAPEPAYEADPDPEPMPAFAKTLPPPPPPPPTRATPPAFVAAPVAAEPDPPGEAPFFAELAPEPEPEPEPEPAAWSDPVPATAPQPPPTLAAEPLVPARVEATAQVAPPVAMPAAALPPVVVPEPNPALAAARPAAEPVAVGASPPSNLLTLAALSNAWQAAPVAPAFDRPAEPKWMPPAAGAPVPAAAPPPGKPEPALPPPAVAAAVAQAPAPEPAGELNIFQLAWSRAAVAADNANHADQTAGDETAAAADRAVPPAAVPDTPMPSERDLFRRI